MSCSEIPPSFKCRSSSKFPPTPWSLFIRVAFVSQIYSPGLRSASSTKTSLGSIRVTRICNWIYERIEYLSGTSTPTTSAFDTVTELAGVCRDFGHLAIAFCRSLGIPARFVSAYAYGLNPPDFHVYIEAFLGGRWILFDPTRLAPQSSFVRIGHGRDAADTSFATIFGGAVMNKMELSMIPADGRLTPPPYTIAPISNYPA